MEAVAIVLSALIGLVSPVGWVVDQAAETAIRQQLDSAESLAVRIDNIPSYQLAQGRIDRVRIAGRGLFPVADVRVDTLELETDPIRFDPASLRGQPLTLEAPLQAAFRVVLTEADLNQALRSDWFTDQLDDLNLDFLGSPSGETYDVVNPEIELLGENRLRFQATLQTQTTAVQTQVMVETGISIQSGSQVQLLSPSIWVNEEAFPLTTDRPITVLRLENQEPLLRILNLAIDSQELQLVGFVRVDP